MVDYDSIPAIRHTALKLFRENPLAYYQTYVTGEMPQRAATKSTEFGSLLHTLVLEPHTVGERYTVVEKLDMRTNADKKLVADAAAAGLTVVKQSEWDAANKAWASIQSHPIAKRLLSVESFREIPIVWNDAETGLDLKIKIDICIPAGLALPMIVDLKTSTSPEPHRFPNAIYDYGYHTQQAMYTEGAELHYDMPFEWAWIVVRNEPPYDCYVHEPGDDIADYGRLMYREALRKLSGCIRTNDWSNPGQKEVNILEPSFFMRKEIERHEYRISENAARAAIDHADACPQI